MESTDNKKENEYPVFEDVDSPVAVPVPDPAENGATSGKLQEENLLDAQEVDDVDDNLPKSSAENIIPMEKLKNGWLAMSGFMMSTAQKAKTSAVEAYNSESVANFKKRTSEVATTAWEKTGEAWEKTGEAVTPAWEKTCEVAAPIWTSTVATASYAAEKTKENAAYASETINKTVQEKWKQYNNPGADAGVELNSEGVPHTSETDVPVTAQPLPTPPTDTPPTATGPPTIV